MIVGHSREEILPGAVPTMEKKGRDDEQVGYMKGSNSRMPI
jgi:hypothetical protein